MSAPADEPDAEARFAERFVALAPTRADRDLVDAIRPEAAIVMQAFVEAVGEGELPAIGGPELRESLTLSSLLGRRAALLEATPAAALELAPALVDALAPDLDLATLVDSLRTTILDGYVRGCEERLHAEAARRAAEAIPIVELAPGCMAVFLRGLQDADALEPRIDDLGRRLMKRDAKACIVDATDLKEPDAERAAQLFGVRAACAMLGVRDFYVGVTEPWQRALTERGVDLREITLVDRLPDALEQALEVCGLEVRAPIAIERAFRRLLGV